MKRIVILGATGSIGESALNVVRDNPGEFVVVGVTGGSNARRMADICREFQPELAAMADPAARRELADELNDSNTMLFRGEDGLNIIAGMKDCDVVISAIVGAAGLMPTLTAIKGGKRIALANKESLVMAGHIVMAEAKKRGAEIIPVDSEHSAIFQSLAGTPAKSINRILLTASGGPFRNTPTDELENVTPEMALRHPTWDMGRKISIDSATMMNKALEIIEAKWLFDVESRQIEVVIHPQSIVHSMVEFVDGSVIAQMGMPSMELPVQYALTYPERTGGGVPRLDITQVGSLVFEKPDIEKFPSLGFAYRAAESGGLMPTAMNAANEIAVEKFLAGKISFRGIFELVERCMDKFEAAFPSKKEEQPPLEEILNTDRIVRDIAAKEKISATQTNKTE